MREQIIFLKISSIIVKVTGWILLLFGVLGLLAILMKQTAGYPSLAIFVSSVVYIFFFFLFILIARIAEVLITVINEIHKEE